MSPNPIASSSVPFAVRSVDADDAALLKRVSEGDKAALAAGLAVIALLEAGGLAMLGIRHGDAGAPPNYRTLSEPNAAVTRATIQLVADAVMPVGQLQTLLAPLHLQIVGGPGENGVYSLAPSAGHVDVAAQLSTLPAAPHVRFAEPVGCADGGV